MAPVHHICSWRTVFAFICVACLGTPRFTAGAPIVFESSEGISVIEPDGSGLRLLSPGGRDPALSPTGESVLIADADLSLWEYEIDGSGRRFLSERGTGPAWNADGSRVAFIQRGILIVSPLESVSPREVDSRVVAARWSPVDRDLLYYMHDRPESLDLVDIRRVNVSTMDTSTFLSGANFPATYAFSSDGSQMLFGRYGGGRSLWIIDVVSRQTRQVGIGGREGPSTAAWSPEGHTIAYDLFSGTKGLFTTSLDGEDVLKVVNGSFEAAPYAPAWSPDGEMIAFHMRNLNGGPDRLHIVNRDGSGLRFLTLGSYPHWTPAPSIGVGLPSDVSAVDVRSWARAKESAMHADR